MKLITRSRIAGAITALLLAGTIVEPGSARDVQQSLPPANLPSPLSSAELPRVNEASNTSFVQYYRRRYRRPYYNRYYYRYGRPYYNRYYSPRSYYYPRYYYRYPGYRYPGYRYYYGPRYYYPRGTYFYFGF